MFGLERNDLTTALKLFVFLTVFTGIIYPIVVTGFAQIFFPQQANGSLVKKGNKTVGSLLIGQSFTDPGYFWGRPSATPSFPYNGQHSSGSNMAPSNPAFVQAIQDRVSRFHQYALDKKILVPVDLVTASGSGLDPEISILGALYQVSRIATIRHLKPIDLVLLITEQRVQRTFGILGEPRVNVLKLNLALDALEAEHG